MRQNQDGKANKATFHNGHEDSQAIIRYIKTDIRERISLDHFRLSQSDFASAWELHFVKLPTLLFMFFSSLVNFIVINVQRHS